jgi:hypothetical protein
MPGFIQRLLAFASLCSIPTSRKADKDTPQDPELDPEPIPSWNGVLVGDSADGVALSSLVIGQEVMVSRAGKMCKAIYQACTIREIETEEDPMTSSYPSFSWHYEVLVKFMQIKSNGTTDVFWIEVKNPRCDHVSNIMQNGTGYTFEKWVGLKTPFVNHREMLSTKFASV